ncbi:thioredoxin family protein [Clostridium perfringens]|uniref:thioredoxin family protein n=1 Tax=Clostridium perfringens TaxID=1502 RepID=UPI00109439ED|nr:thioredoxin family protein [Clostridium perfringens]MDK0651535.1 thioredoxin family protein [Clostridium perfringens]MDM0627428.1 thioredoxin family protein [Clostridium perfringens]TGY43039.1 thioredoxin [Clostridium perfringens]
MKKVVVTILAIITIIVILTFSISNLIQNEKPLYKDSSINEVKMKIQNKESFILYLYQKQCPSCLQIKPIINEYIQSTGNEILAVDINNDKDKNFIVQDLNISGTPTVIFYKEGNEISRLISVFNEELFLERAQEIN